MVCCVNVDVNLYSALSNSSHNAFSAANTAEKCVFHRRRKLAMLSLASHRLLLSMFHVVVNHTVNSVITLKQLSIADKCIMFPNCRIYHFLQDYHLSTYS